MSLSYYKESSLWIVGTTVISFVRVLRDIKVHDMGEEQMFYAVSIVMRRLSRAREE